MKENRAFFWIANGGHYVDEAVLSAKSVKEHMPDIPQFIFIIDGSMRKEFDQTGYIARKYQTWYLQSTYMMVHALSRFDEDGYWRAIYMDTDTYMIEPVYELFEILNEFDFVGSRAPGRKTCTHMDNRYPSSLFPEINMGVNPMRISSANSLWTRVLERYIGYDDTYGNNDQGPLRDSLIAHMMRNEEFRFYVMPQEYNCRFIMPCFLNGRVKILHGRNPDISSIATKINEREGMRLWQPYQLV